MTEPNYDVDAHGGHVPRIDTMTMVADLLARANKCDAHIQQAYREASATLARAKIALLNCVRHNELTQPYLVSDENWNARYVECATNIVSYSLRIPGGPSSMHGEPCSRKFAAQDACNEAHRALDRVPRDTRYLHAEMNLLRRLASDVRMGRLGVKRTDGMKSANDDDHEHD